MRSGKKPSPHFSVGSNKSRVNISVYANNFIRLDGFELVQLIRVFTTELIVKLTSGNFTLNFHTDTFMQYYENLD